MTKLHLAAVTLTGAAALTIGLTGCGSDDAATTPSDSTTVTTSVSTGPVTTEAPSPTTAEPAQDSSRAPATGMTPNGPSRTVSVPSSATPPIQGTPAPPTGDNLPGEDDGPAGRPGAPGDDN